MKVTALFLASMAFLVLFGAEGKDCWYKCGRKSGPCNNFCGSGNYCCRQGSNWIENGCDGKVGGKVKHECTSNTGGAVSCNNLENLVNNYRRSRGLKTLQCHDKPRYLAQIHVYDLRDADYNCGDLHAWRSNKWTGGVGTCKRGNKYTCKMMAKHQGKEFVLKTRHYGYAEISDPGRDSDQGRFNGWKNSDDHDAIMRSTDYNIFGCYNQPNGEFSHCIFQKLGGYASCSKYLD